MNRIAVAVVALMFALQTASAVEAQQQPNFSGTWKLAKQDPPTTGRGGGRGGGDDRGALRALEASPVTVKIAQSGNDLTFESTMSDGWVRTRSSDGAFSPYTTEKAPTRPTPARFIAGTATLPTKVLKARCFAPGSR